MWLGFALRALLVPMTFIDLDHRIIPNKITVPGGGRSAIVLVAASSTPTTSLEHLIAGAAALPVPVRRRARLPGRHGDGGRQARRRDGPVPGPRRRPGACSSRCSPGTLVGIGVIAAKGVEEGRKTAVPVRPVPRPRRPRRPVRRRRHRRLVPGHLRLGVRPARDGPPEMPGADHRPGGVLGRSMWQSHTFGPASLPAGAGMPAFRASRHEPNHWRRPRASSPRLRPPIPQGGVPRCR